MVKYFRTEDFGAISSGIETSDGRKILLYFDLEGMGLDFEWPEKLEEYTEHLWFDQVTPDMGVFLKSNQQGKLPLEFFIELSRKIPNFRVFDQETFEVLTKKWSEYETPEENAEYLKCLIDEKKEIKDLDNLK
jgi:hypothetical protein